MKPARYAVNQLYQRTTAHVASLPSPIGGWNARDSIANMPPQDAITLENLFPTVSNVVLRGGSTDYATGMSGSVETLMVYSGGSTDKLFAIDATGKSIYNVTAGGSVGAPDVSGLNNARWEYANISTPGGNFLECVNGIDDLQLYDGTTWTTINSGSSPAITGVATADLTNILLFKNRLWFIQKDTLKAWYLPTQSIAGAAQPFDLSSVATKGGYLVAMGAWTVDGGYGMDDNLVFITSNGEVMVYRGTDPASAATWAEVGVWALGSPVGKRCMLKWAGDLLIITQDGLLPMAQALQSSRLDPRVALSDKIQLAISQAISIYGNNFGWQPVYYPKQNAVFVNVPISVGQQQQYAMNTVTTAWCSFDLSNLRKIAVLQN